MSPPSPPPMPAVPAVPPPPPPPPQLSSSLSAAQATKAQAGAIGSGYGNAATVAPTPLIDLNGKAPDQVVKPGAMLGAGR